jgi:hypothetical protein
MPDYDLIIMEDAKEAAFALDKAYRRAMLNADLDTMTELKPKVDEAYDSYSSARLRLISQGTVATEQDVAELRRIRAEIEQAATTQSLILGAIEFIAFLARFA